MRGIEVRNIAKNYGEVQALKNVSVFFGENKIYGLLGRNGAGKPRCSIALREESFLTAARSLWTESLPSRMIVLKGKFL